MKRILKDFAFASDNNYTLQIKVAVSSLLHSFRTNTDGVRVHILDMGIAEDRWGDLVSTWGALSPSVEIIRHRVDERMVVGFRLWNGSLATYARLFLPELITDAEWCLYADGDTFFAADPIELEECLKDDLALIGHRNPLNLTEAIDRPWLCERGLPCAVESYLCAGLVLMNLALFRAETLKVKAFAFLREHPDSVSADQSALNVVCFGKTGLLPEGWGVFAYESVLCPDCKCVHYVSMTPWAPPNNWMLYCGEHEMLAIWYEFAAKKLGIAGLKRKYQPFWKRLVPRMTASLVYPFIVLLSMMRLYPVSFTQHAAAIRQRLRANAATRMRKRVFG